jgi:hypothetical protein
MASLRRLPGKFFKHLCFLLLAITAVGAGREEEQNPIAVPQELRTAPRQLCVKLQWEPAQGSMGYDLERAKTPDGPFEPLHNDLPQLTVYNDFVDTGATNFYYRVRSIQTNGLGHVLPSDWSKPVEGHPEPLDREQLITEVQQTSFDYFYQYAHPVSGLARASVKRDPDICAIGASGMGFFNLGVGIERGFITRQEGAEQALKELQFLSAKAERFHGAFPHFINGKTGKVIPFSKYDDGADIVETAFLMQGILFAREYFSGTNDDEIEIREIADHLWRNVEWNWFVSRTDTNAIMLWHWSPNYGFKKNLRILGFNECQIVYVLGLASPTHPIEPKSYWKGWESPYYGVDRTQFGIHVKLGNGSDVGPPLFWTQYSYLGLDPRQIMFRGQDYFDHFRDLCLVQVRYAESKENVYKGYGPLWGITASAGPDGYMAFAPGVHDKGTLAPTASLSSMPYVPAESLSCLNEMYEKYGAKLWGPFGFYDSFNFTRNWVSKTYLCIDEGPIAPMIENYRSGFCWKIFMKCPEIQLVVKMLNEGDATRHTNAKNLPNPPAPTNPIAATDNSQGANPMAAAPLPNFGPDVLMFNPAMPAPAIQSALNRVFAEQQNGQFSKDRYALFFLPGRYTNLDVNLGYYMQVIGLGQMPDDVVIDGNVHSEGTWYHHNATGNFWRSCENMAVVPDISNMMTWAVSQDTSLRRMHIMGNLNLANLETNAYASGGFLADSKIDLQVNSKTQQQWLSRNDVWGSWKGHNWNMVFVGVSNAPPGSWPHPPYTVIPQTPLVREKPYFYVDAHTNFFVMVPSLERNSSGTSWADGPTPGVSVPIRRFYLARPHVDNAGTINAALDSGLNLILTPGIYFLTNSIRVTRPDTIVLGLGFPSLVPTNRNPAMVIGDVNGVNVSDIIFDAGTEASPSLLTVGPIASTVSHSADPISLYDICCRVGGQFRGATTNCVTINANNVIGDNLWLWRADHGTGARPRWIGNPSQSGLVVNGNDVTMYGLFVEHHQKYQTLWNGNGGRVYLYQSELPYDPPSQSVWSEAPGVDGYASYKVSDAVTSHHAYGLGIYAVFTHTKDVSCFNAIETPSSPQVNVYHMMDVYITGNTSPHGTSELTHIINGTGSTVASPGVAEAYADSLRPTPASGADVH